MIMESHLIFLIVTFLSVTLGKPQDRSQSDNAPKWSTQRSNFFPGADQDLTLPSNNQQQQPHKQQQHQHQQPAPKLIFPSRFQPIVGVLPGRGPRYQEQESRVQHNYYPVQEFARGSNISPVFQTTATTPSTTTESTTVPTTTTLPTPAPALGDNREIRFLIHKPGDEEIIKRALYEDSMATNEQISFIQGPTIKLEQKQKVVLPPKQKTIVYVFIKEPEIETKVEMVDHPETAQDQPQVFIFYQKAGANKGQKEHYPGKAKSSSASASVNLGTAVLNPNKHLNSGKAPSASNQIEQTVDPPPPGCPTGLTPKN